MFDFPLPFSFEDNPGLLAVANASAKLRDTIEFTPTGHEDLKDYFLDISMALVIGLTTAGGDEESLVDLLNHVEGIVRDIYSRLEVRV
ncbi:hypothetical protein [Actinomadura sp. WMMB 499]|uniref:hypothetical protein n=1 Tax=Actinomadura sp. WMMB 499 TaxID=1219491 RepID=UPI00124623BC|nr:hypothetical protein [Actinomadura sp. WMMB 499]QFG25462.1 hypothetical protein F7P10_34280 [Actinomadura sp. WMMB 499]